MENDVHFRWALRRALENQMQATHSRSTSSLTSTGPESSSPTQTKNSLSIIKTLRSPFLMEPYHCTILGIHFFYKLA